MQIVENKNYLSDLKNALPYQYAAQIASKILTRKDIKESITNKQVRLVFEEKITNPAIVIPVLEEAHKLYEEVQTAKKLIEKPL